MKLRNCLIVVVLILLSLAIACGGLNAPTVAPTLTEMSRPTLTSMPASTSTPIPTPTSVPTSVPSPSPSPMPTPTVIPQREYFFALYDIWAAYSDDDVDQSFIPYTLNEVLNKQDSRMKRFPTAVMIAYNDDKSIFIESGAAEYPVWLIDHFAVTSYFASNAPAPRIPPDLKDQNFSVALALKFGEDSEGKPDYEILGKSVARNSFFLMEIFERKENSAHPYPAFFPFEIQVLGVPDDPKIIPGQQLIFYGTSKAEGKTQLTQKRASISSVDYKRSLMAMNGSVTPGDPGGLVFVIKCGVQKVVGVVLGSKQGEGKENEAFVLGIEAVFRFVEENIGITIQTHESGDSCPESDFILKERYIRAVSDGLPDSSYALADAKNALRDLDLWWIRPFESVVSPEGEPEKERAASLGNAFLIKDRYVGALVSAIGLSPFSTIEDGDRVLHEGHKYRILWGGTIDGDENEPVEYEYLEFLGFDDSGRFALFQRPENTKFPIPDDLPFAAGSSTTSEVGDKLYITGITDFSIFVRDVSYPIHRSIDPATIIGFAPQKDDTFYFQASFSEDDVSSPLFQIVDGDLYVVGFFHGPMNDWETETLGTALSVDFVIRAMEEITCSNPSIPCLDFSGKLYTRKPEPRSEQARGDRYQIISTLRRRGLAPSSLMTDLLKPDVSVLSQYEGRIVIFLVDETGTMIMDKVIEGGITFLSDEYALTASSLFPQFITQSESGFGLDTNDVTSNVLFSDEGGRRVEVRIGVVDKFSYTQEMFNLFQDIPFILEVLENISDPAFLLDMKEDELRKFVVSIQNTLFLHGEERLGEEMNKNPEDPAYIQGLLGRGDYRRFFQKVVRKMQILDVVLIHRIDQENGFAFLRRSTPPPNARTGEESLRIATPEDITPDKEILISYSQYIFRDLLSRLKRVSPGTIVYATPSSPIFVINGFVSEKILGSPISVRCGDETCLLGIVARPYPNIPDKIQTEGFGLSIDFIFQRIKEKTGIDLYEEINK